MYPERKPMCRQPDRETEECGDRKTGYKRNPVSGIMERITEYKDGSSIRHGSGPAGPMYYDQFGEEC